MLKINFEFSGIKNDIFSFNKTKVIEIHSMIHDKTGLGNDFLGWLDWPENYNKSEYKKMKEVAINLAKQIDVLLVVGIGGSYLGTRAANDMINGLYNKKGPEIIYIGNTMSSTYNKQVLDYVKDKEFGIVNVSKSGTTTEPGIAFRIFQKLLIDIKGEEVAKKRIVAITDKSKGALKELATKNGYETFDIPDDIGGRFSVTTPVGIFPLLVMGIDTDAIFKGALKAQKELDNSDLEKNTAYQYAVARFLMFSTKKAKMENFATYELQLQMFTEWWKQLFGESEGKEGKGLFPTSCTFSTDLHSLGQFIQEGTKDLMFETILKIVNPTEDIKIPTDKENLDGLNYLTSKTFHKINSIAIDGVIDAHSNSGNIPNILLELEKMDAEAFGYISYWFMKACAMSGYLLGINPFNQPGVEVYKKNMFKLLEKPGS